MGRVIYRLWRENEIWIYAGTARLHAKKKYMSITTHKGLIWAKYEHNLMTPIRTHSLILKLIAIFL